MKRLASVFIVLFLAASVIAGIRYTNVGLKLKSQLALSS